MYNMNREYVLHRIHRFARTPKTDLLVSWGKQNEYSENSDEMAERGPTGEMENRQIGVFGNLDNIDEIL